MIIPNHYLLIFKCRSDIYCLVCNDYKRLPMYMYITYDMHVYFGNDITKTNFLTTAKSRVFFLGGGVVERKWIDFKGFRS